MYKRLIVTFLILAGALLPAYVEIGMSAFTCLCRMQQQKECFFLSFL